MLKNKVLDKLKNKIGKFEGDLMIVYSQRYKDLLLEAGIIDKKELKLLELQEQIDFLISG